MPERELAAAVKRSNILDMALTFTAMMRLFGKGSKNRIAEELHALTSRLSEVNSANDFEERHKAFCEWFCREISTAAKSLKKKRRKPSRPASFGHAAKVLDIVLKVYVFYCSEPSPEVASRVRPFLHGAIDNPIMNHLKAKYKDIQIHAATIEQINEEIYRSLQRLIAREIRDSFQDNLLPVQYDDVMWQRLNRGLEIGLTSQLTCPAKSCASHTVGRQVIASVTRLP